jgi:hypothetical protein|tara:strand:- start:900 stop:1265 length:366 start_codon:yes stop_codon:yes gene_type:complete
MNRTLCTGFLLAVCIACLIVGFTYNHFFILVGAIVLVITSAIQFPFREEEGWECSCGYDLSYMHKQSTKCPECGKTAQLEWSSMAGELPRKTSKRLYQTVFFMVTSLVLFLIFAVLVFFKQ